MSGRIARHFQQPDGNRAASGELVVTKVGALFSEYPRAQLISSYCCGEEDVRRSAFICSIRPAMLGRLIEGTLREHNM
jgi:hypothetical protein